MGHRLQERITKGSVMNQMTKRIREDRSGFTLAELLIVVGILLVLMAIAIPVFTGALGKAEAAVASANARSAKSEALAKYGLESNAAEKTKLQTQYFFYNDKGDEVKEGASDIKYTYTVTITVTNGDVTATVTEGKTGPA